ncbi:uncharacterized protein LOC126372053 [Pectinophora gossypiella]|uniref:uncharacterized protein LOC126372053 n=1 Tax=Pectinophora gossypiella TaxID=13191 RepID=UPI00214F3300|nr:uncharacterized protein LOC126372053 [Pectinophora gossypiella]
MMSSSVPLLLLTLSSALSTLSAPYDGYTQVVVPQKRAALMLDRLLMALQKALHEDGERPERDGPRAAPLRIAGLDDVGNDMMALYSEVGVPAPAPAPRDFVYEPHPAPLHIAALDDDKIAPKRRGQGVGRADGRVLRCYFNAITCF